jgi:hypothetical protein
MITDHLPEHEPAAAIRDTSDRIVLFRGFVTNRQLEAETAQSGHAPAAAATGLRTVIDTSLRERRPE